MVTWNRKETHPRDAPQEKTVKNKAAFHLQNSVLGEGGVS